MVDLNNLTVFAKVVQAGSFSEAARSLDRPVSTASRRIAELEAQFGTRLLQRSTRNMRLTEAGAGLLDHARQAEGLHDAVRSPASDHQTDMAGLLRLSAPPSVSDTLVAPLVGAFQAAHPRVRVQVLVTDRHVDHVAEGVDLALRFGPRKDSPR